MELTWKGYGIRANALREEVEEKPAHRSPRND
jgi:hypothetical protein